MLLLRTVPARTGLERVYVCMYVCVCGAPASGSHTHTSIQVTQVSVLLAAEQRGCVTVCSALCSRLSFHALAAN